MSGVLGVPCAITKAPKVTDIAEPDINTFIQLDDIAGLLVNLIKVETANSVTINNQQKAIDQILYILNIQRDKGEHTVYTGTATTDFNDNIIDLTITTAKKVKGFVLFNEGKQTIQIAYNIASNPANIGHAIPPANLIPVKAGKTEKLLYKEPLINSLYLQTITGTCNYSLLLLW